MCLIKNILIKYLILLLYNYIYLNEIKEDKTYGY